MPKVLNLVEAATSFILSLPQSIITDYQIGSFVFQTYLSKKYGDHNLRLQKKFPQKGDYNRLIQSLFNQDIITPRNDVPRLSVFNIQNKPPASKEEIFCLIDPFCYVSHLSAMMYHKLLMTNKTTEQTIFLSSYPLTSWREHASIFMRKDCGGEENFKEYQYSGLPRLKKLKKGAINKTKVVEFNNKNIGGFQTGRIRVSTIARTFLDMLRRPDLCGGVKLVLDIYNKHALNYLEPILKEIDSNGTKIEKSRAGYVLEETCNIKDEKIESWLQFVQRGSSRKLDPSKEFSSVYSERWCLSLNI